MQTCPPQHSYPEQSRNVTGPEQNRIWDFTWVLSILFLSLFFKAPVGSQVLGLILTTHLILFLSYYFKLGLAPSHPTQTQCSCARGVFHGWVLTSFQGLVPQICAGSSGSTCVALTFSEHDSFLREGIVAAIEKVFSMKIFSGFNSPC